MCLGIPMQVLAMQGEHSARCRGMGEEKDINMSLVGVQQEGSWVITFLGAAREVVDEAEAMQITAALQAVDLAMQGNANGIDSLFADIIERGPQLPPHLKANIDKE